MEYVRNPVGQNFKLLDRKIEQSSQSKSKSGCIKASIPFDCITIATLMRYIGQKTKKIW